VRGDRPVVERVASRHVEDRTAVEGAYRAGDAAQRRALLTAALKHGDAAQLDLLRLAVFGLDTDLSKVARSALTKVEDPNATALVAEALAVPMEAGEREALIATLKRLGSSSVLARWLAVVHQGLAAKAGPVDPATWPKDAAPTYTPAYELGGLPLHLEDLARAARAAEGDPVPRLELAEASLQLALEAAATYPTDPRRARLAERALLMDARAAAREAERLGATGWRVSAALSLSAYYAGDLEEGYTQAQAAIKDLPPGDPTWTSMAVLTVFAESRWKAIKKAVKEKLDFPPEWLTDVHAAYAVLLKHPLGTEDQVLWHHDLMDWLGADAQADRILRAGIARWQGSPALHARLRTLILRKSGPAALEPAYEALLQENASAPILLAYAGLASTAVAEQQRRFRALEPALASYQRAIARWEAAAAADARQKETADAAIALALAARARVLYQLEKDDLALADLLASFARSPAAAGSRDGMGITPGETGQMLYARLKTGGRVEQAAQLEAALGALDPELLRPDRE
jgi:hypothetical protein